MAEPVHSRGFQGIPGKHLNTHSGTLCKAPLKDLTQWILDVHRLLEDTHFLDALILTGNIRAFQDVILKVRYIPSQFCSKPFLQPKGLQWTSAQITHSGEDAFYNLFDQKASYWHQLFHSKPSFGRVISEAFCQCTFQSINLNKIKVLHKNLICTHYGNHFCWSRLPQSLQDYSRDKQCIWMVTPLEKQRFLCSPWWESSYRAWTNLRVWAWAVVPAIKQKSQYRSQNKPTSPKFQSGQARLGPGSKWPFRQNHYNSISPTQRTICVSGPAARRSPRVSRGSNSSVSKRTFADFQFIIQ